MVPLEGEIKLLEYMLNKSSADNAVLHLYRNEVTLSQTTVLSHFTECSDASYAAIVLQGSNWSVVADTDRALATYAEQVFSFATGQNVWGYFVTNNSGTALLWAQEANCAPTRVPDMGGTVVVRPKIYARKPTSS